MNDNTELPTADRRQELREKGLVSYSSRSGACLLIAAFSVAALGAPPLLQAYAALYQIDASGTGWLEIGKNLRAVAITWLLIPAAIAATVLTVWGLFQTRFLFNPGLASLDFTRMFSLDSMAPGSLTRRLGASLVALLIAGLGSVFLLKMAGMQVFRSLHQAGSANTAAALSELGAMLPILILISTLSALMLLLFEKLRFALANRMSRKEVLAEQKG